MSHKLYEQSEVNYIYLCFDFYLSITCLHYIFIFYICFYSFAFRKSRFNVYLTNDSNAQRYTLAFIDCHLEQCVSRVSRNHMCCARKQSMLFLAYDRLELRLHVHLKFIWAFTHLILISCLNASRWMKSTNVSNLWSYLCFEEVDKSEQAQDYFCQFLAKFSTL